MKIKALFIVVFALDVTGAFSLAQNSDKPEPPTGDTIIYQQAPPPEVYSTGQAPGAVVIHREGIGNRTGPATFGWIASEMSFEGTIVKGAPYSAEAITETTQTLSDGNRIQRRNSASVFRDSQGRVRREQTLDQIGPWAGSGEALQTTFINDPVAGVKFILDPKERTARKVPMGDFVKSSDAPPMPASGDVRFERKIGPGGAGHFEFSQVFFGDSAKPTTESLGKRVIEGVESEGTRTTVTISAGQIGNELPIQIVSERWFSPELQVVILSKHNDPRMGETVYRLSNINRSEQPRTLFEVPSDYKIVESSPNDPPFFLFNNKVKGPR